MTLSVWFNFKGPTVSFHIVSQLSLLQAPPPIKREKMCLLHIPYKAALPALSLNCSKQYSVEYLTVCDSDVTVIWSTHHISMICTIHYVQYTELLYEFVSPKLQLPVENVNTLGFITCLWWCVWSPSLSSRSWLQVQYSSWFL